MGESHRFQRRSHADFPFFSLHLALTPLDFFPRFLITSQDPVPGWWDFSGASLCQEASGWRTVWFLGLTFFMSATPLDFLADRSFRPEGVAPVFENRLQRGPDRAGAPFLTAVFLYKTFGPARVSATTLSVFFSQFIQF